MLIILGSLVNKRSQKTIREMSKFSSVFLAVVARIIALNLITISGLLNPVTNHAISKTKHISRDYVANPMGTRMLRITSKEKYPLEGMWLFD